MSIPVVMKSSSRDSGGALTNHASCSPPTSEPIHIKTKSARLSNLFKKSTALIDSATNLNPEEIRKLKKDQIKYYIDTKEDLLTEIFFQNLCILELESLPEAYLIDKIASDKIWPLLSNTQRTILDYQREIYLAQNHLHNYTIEKLEKLSPSIFKDVSLQCLTNLNNKSIISILNLFWREIPIDRCSFLFEKLTPELKEFTDPELQITMLEDQNRQVDTLLEKANYRKQLREQIIYVLGHVLEMNWLSRHEKVGFIKVFINLYVQHFIMKSPFYTEAKTMSGFNFQKELTDFDTFEDFIDTQIKSHQLDKIEFSRPLKPSGLPIHDIDFSELIRTYSNTSHVSASTSHASANARDGQHFFYKKEPSCSIAVGSLYPIDHQTSHRHGDPIAEDMRYLKWLEGTTILSASVGGGWRVADQSAVKANESFMLSLVRFLEHGLYSNDKVMIAILRSLEAIKKVFENEGTASHLSIIAQHQEETKWKFFVSHLGNFRVFHYKAKEEFAFEVLGNTGCYLPFKNQKGGRFGVQTDAPNPDLSNLAILQLEGEEGDYIIPVTQGVFNNFDPEYLLLSPHYVWEFLKGQKAVFPTGFQNELDLKPLTKWLDTLEHQRLKMKYEEILITSIIKHALEKGREPAFEIAKYCRKNTHVKREWMRDHPHDKDPLNLRESKRTQIPRSELIGDLRHFSVAAIHLLPLMAPINLRIKNEKANP